MPSFEVLEEKPISMAEMKVLLKGIKERDEELSFRGNKTEEYLGQFVDISDKKALETIQNIRELNIPRLKDEHIVKIVDIWPGNMEELKVVLQGYTITVSKENMEKIVKAL